MDGCAMATLDKCSADLKGRRPKNMIEVSLVKLKVFLPENKKNSVIIIIKCLLYFLQKIGDIGTIQDCQWFCNYIYGGSCNWFLHDNRTGECKIFGGQLDDLFNDCKESSFSASPSFDKCTSAFTPSSENGCYVNIISYL